MKISERVLLITLAVAGLYALSGSHPSGIVAVLMALGIAWLGRNRYRSKVAANPMGEDRDYSLRPVAEAVLKCVGSFAALLLWSGLWAYALKRHYIPDNPLGVALGLAPAVALLALGVIYVVRAMTRFQYGGQPPAGPDNRSRGP